ncbi:MAG: DUF1992 domain-containing protein [Burkholderiales bacterium]|nr:DUF1992 domain-containing protein [Burkholderiales bacterium]
MRASHPGPPALLDALAERHITEAAARGAFDDLPGAGAPLPPEDLELVPEELRTGYRLLKNSSYLPSELLPCAELKVIERLLARSESGEDRRGLLARMNFLLSRRAEKTRNLRVDEDYFVRGAEQLGS